MTKDEFIAANQNELVGLLMASFVEAMKPGEFSKQGAMMIQQMRKGREFLGRMYDDMNHKIIHQPLKTEQQKPNGTKVNS